MWYRREERFDKVCKHLTLLHCIWNDMVADVCLSNKTIYVHVVKRWTGKIEDVAGPKHTKQWKNARPWKRHSTDKCKGIFSFIHVEYFILQRVLFALDSFNILLFTLFRYNLYDRPLHCRYTNLYNLDVSGGGLSKMHPYYYLLTHVKT